MASPEGVEGEFFCEIQGNWNPIFFSQESLDSKPYPYKCDEGNWVTDERGVDEEIYGCLAYKPRLETDPEKVTEMEIKHRDFMLCLSEVAKIYYAIKFGNMEKLLERLRVNGGRGSCRSCQAVGYLLGEGVIDQHPPPK